MHTKNNTNRQLNIKNNNTINSCKELHNFVKKPNCSWNKRPSKSLSTDLLCWITFQLLLSNFNSVPVATETSCFFPISSCFNLPGHPRFIVRNIFNLFMWNDRLNTVICITSDFVRNTVQIIIIKKILTSLYKQNILLTFHILRPHTRCLRAKWLISNCRRVSGCQRY